jgi:hypothetical protein
MTAERWLEGMIDQLQPHVESVLFIGTQFSILYTFMHSR